ncbi:hypothetical protein MC7420_5948 [Coleofasciculus chthonoplastes PCC 7420]|uniref:Uncharacterized protein n=1 Tax=Coleofasciculus chthonoplastes PCC 7420 TaxID=118168 RepID=B4W4Y1_9CYAN|nr:hypothetical protein MC7420_5948 [Coleofasciculus chthonoplastes PCC 7420]
MLRRFKGFSCVRISFAYDKPTVDNIPENRTLISQLLSAAWLAREQV